MLVAAASKGANSLPCITPWLITDGQRLNAAALNNEYEHLVLMADPQTLGQIRPQLHKETERRIVMEVAKTFTNAPLEDIQNALVEK